jgi:hypothetical protein
MSELLDKIIAELPKGWSLGFDVENGDVTIGLSDWDGDWCEEEFTGTPTEKVLAALEYAKERGNMGLVTAKQWGSA